MAVMYIPEAKDTRDVQFITLPEFRWQLREEDSVGAINFRHFQAYVQMSTSPRYVQIASCEGWLMAVDV